jgi:opacity protein-like surface antigen
MKSVYRCCLAGIAVFAGSATAMAADLGGGSMKDTSFQPMMTERPALFYVRGDFTHSSSGFDTISEPATFTHSQAHLGNTRFWGGGVGYHFSPNIRGDLTLDAGSTASVRGTVADPLATVQGERQFGVKHIVGLANLYYDFDPRGRFSPYLGVGLGFARNTTTAGSVAVSGCDAVDPLTGAPACSAAFEGASKNNAAGALMAGISTKLGDRWTLDAGYRFLYLGDAHTGDIQVTRAAGATVTGPAPNSTPEITIHDMYAHQFRVGLRMDVR